jgi:hypothetical protein
VSTIVGGIAANIMKFVFRFPLAITLSVLQFEGYDYPFDIKLVTNQPVLVLLLNVMYLAGEICQGHTCVNQEDYFIG